MKEIRDYARDNGLDIVEIEGGKHTKIMVGGLRTVVARHTHEMCPRKVRKQLGMPDRGQ